MPGREATARASAQRPRSVTQAATETSPHAVRWATTSRAGTAASIFQYRGKSPHIRKAATAAAVPAREAPPCFTGPS